MKITVVCASELLQKSLEIYLKDYLAPIEECDFVISDYQSCDMKPVCLVGTANAHIKTPFTQESLLANCKVFYATYCAESLPILPPKDSRVFMQIDQLFTQTLEDFRQKLYAILRDGGYNAR